MRGVLKCLFVLITFTACLQKEYDYPGKPLVWFDFNENLDNHGMMKLSLTGSKVVSYGTVEKDTVLDLSSQAFYRKPLQFEFPTDFSFVITSYSIHYTKLYDPAFFHPFCNISI